MSERGLNGFEETNPSSFFADGAILVPPVNSNQYSLSNETEKTVREDLGIIVGDVVLTKDEALVYRRIHKVVNENKQLKQALRENGERLQIHYQDCVKWKEKYIHQEKELKLLLEKECRKSQKYQMELQNVYSATKSSSLPSSSLGNSVFKELYDLDEKLRLLLSDNGNEKEDFVQKAIQGTRDYIKEFSMNVPDQRNYDKFKMALSSIQDELINSHTNYGNTVKNTVTNIQEFVRKSSCVPYGQQVAKQDIPLDQYVDLQVRYDMVLLENQKYQLELESSDDLLVKNDNLNMELENLKQSSETLKKQLISKEERIKSLADEIENAKSVEVINIDQTSNMKQIKELRAQITALESVVQKLKKENESLKYDNKETMECFDKLEGNNSRLEEAVNSQQHEIQQLKQILEDVKHQSKSDESAKKVNLLKAEVDRMNTELAVVNEKLMSVSLEYSELQVKYDMVLVENNNFQQQVSKLDYTIDEGNAEVIEALKQNIESLEASNQELKIKHDMLLQQVHENDEKDKSEIVNEDLKENKQDRDNIDMQVEYLKQKILSLEASNQELKITHDIEKQQLLQEVHEKEEKDKSVEINEVEALKQKLHSLEECNKELNNKYINSKAVIKTIRKREDKDADTIDKLTKDNNDMKKHIAELQSIIETGVAEKDENVQNMQMVSMQFINHDDVAEVTADATALVTDLSADEITISATVADKEVSSDDEFQSLTTDEVTDAEKLKQSVEANSLLNEEVEKLKTLNKELESSLDELTTSIKDLEVSKEELQSSNMELQAATDELQQELELNKENVQKLLEECRDSDEKSKKLEEIQLRCSELEIQLEKLTKKNETLIEIKLNLEDELQNHCANRDLGSNQLKILQEQHEVTEHSYDKLKVDYNNLYQTYQQRMQQMNNIKSNAGNQMQHVDMLTSELAAAKDLIVQKENALKNCNKMVSDLQEVNKKIAAEIETVPLLRMQMEVYQNDFNAEREAREKQHSELLREKDKIQELLLENNRLTEELSQFGNQQMSELRQRHSTRQAPEQNRNNQQAHLYGRGSGKRNAVPEGDRDDLAQRQCPKCQKLFPDLDTLQIHVMECLDDNN